MNKATGNNLQEIYKLFSVRKDVFPHIRQDYISRKIEEGNCIYEEGVVIIYSIYKVATKVGFDTRATAGDCILRQIIGTHGQGSATRVLHRFFAYLDPLPAYSGRTYLSVRSDNERAKRFYERNEMELIDNTEWSNGTISGDIYFKQTAPRVPYKPMQMALFSAPIENIFSVKKDVWKSLDADHREQFEQQVFDYYREHGFPYPEWDKETLLKDFRDIQSLDVYSLEEKANDQSIIRHHSAGTKVANFLMPHIFDVKCKYNQDKSGKTWRRSPMETFNDDEMLRRCIKKSLELSGHLNHKTMRGAFSWTNGTQKASNFKPSVAKFIYEKYGDSGDVVDFSCGFGGRLVGAFATKGIRSYRGFEPSTQTYNALHELIAFLGQSRTIETMLYKAGSEDWFEVAEDMTGVDLCFSSPPYFDTEAYAYEDTQSFIRYQTKDEWREGFLIRMLHNCYRGLKQGGILAINVADVINYPDLESDTLSIAKSMGFKHINTHDMALSKLMGGSKNALFKFEPIFILEK